MPGLFDDLVPAGDGWPPAALRIPDQAQPRGLRNNNPGNIEDGPFARSISGYAGSDGRFAKFDTPEGGQAAMDRLLESYGKRGFNTPASIIGRWAPANDGNPVNNYSRYVAEGVGGDPTAQLDLSDPNIRRAVAERITQFENGQRQPAQQRVQATEVSAQSRQPIGLFNDLVPQGAGAASAGSSPGSSPEESTGGRFTDNAGTSFRVAREGVSPTAEPPKSVVDKLVSIWENPPKDKLSLIGMIKSAYEGATLPGDVASGKVSVTGGDGRTNPEVIERSAKLAGASPLSAAPGGVAAAQFGPRILEAQAAKAPVPSAQQLKAAAKSGFESPEIADLAIKPTAIKEFSSTLQARLNESGLDDLLAPKTFGLLSKFEKVPEDAIVTGANLQTLRRTFQSAAGSPDKTERLAAKRVIDAINEFIPNVAARDILSGDPKAAAEAWALARGNYAAAMRSEDIVKAVLKAQRQAEAAGSGANIDNATRQQFKAILNNDKKIRGFDADEIAQMETLVRGTATGNAARLIGKAAPTGIVSGGLAGGAGFAAGGPVGAVLVPLAGYIGKKIGDRSTANQVQALDELVRSRAPLAKAMEDFGVKFQVIERDGQNARSVSALALSARNLANNLRDAGVNLSPTEIMRSIQGPVRSAAEDDQQN
jgi:hypothetical protein